MMVKQSRMDNISMHMNVIRVYKGRARDVIVLHGTKNTIWCRIVQEKTQDSGFHSGTLINMYS